MDKKFKVFVIVALISLAVLAATGTMVALSAINTTKVGEMMLETIQDKDIKIVALNDAITANLVGDERSRNMVRVSIGFGVDSKDKTFKEFSTNFVDKQLVVRNQIINILRAQTYEMMIRNDAQDKLAEEIKNNVNEVLGTQVIKEVYFGEFFVQ